MAYYYQPSYKLLQRLLFDTSPEFASPLITLPVGLRIFHSSISFNISKGSNERRTNKSIVLRWSFTGLRFLSTFEDCKYHKPHLALKNSITIYHINSMRPYPFSMSTILTSPAISYFVTTMMILREMISPSTSPIKYICPNFKQFAGSFSSMIGCSSLEGWISTCCISIKEFLLWFDYYSQCSFDVEIVQCVMNQDLFVRGDAHLTCKVKARKEG